MSKLNLTNTIADAIITNWHQRYYLDDFLKKINEMHKELYMYSVSDKSGYLSDDAREYRNQIISVIDHVIANYPMAQSSSQLMPNPYR